jgi:hypothetical protein
MQSMVVDGIIIRNALLQEEALFPFVCHSRFPREAESSVGDRTGALCCDGVNLLPLKQPVRK